MDNTQENIYHNIYILDVPELTQKNVNFLEYIKRNQSLLKSMKVIINIFVTSQVGNLTVANFPVLVTKNKTYYGLHDIVIVYESNIREYNNYINTINKKEIDTYRVSKNTDKKNNESEYLNDSKNITIDNNEDTDNQLHQYIQSNLRITSNDDIDDDVSPIGDIGSKSMMDHYNYMLDKRSKSHKNPYAPRKNNDIAMMSSSSNSSNSNNKSNNKNMQDMMFQQLQGSMSGNKQYNKEDADVYEKEDNIKAELTEETINIDPSKIEHDDEDPQDNIMEQAYWNRISETK